MSNRQRNDEEVLIDTKPTATERVIIVFFKPYHIEQQASYFPITRTERKRDKYTYSLINKEINQNKT